MPVKPNSIVPALIEQIFKKYAQIFDEQSEKGILTKASFEPLLIELDAIFGNVLKVALRILSEQTITIYTTENNLRSIAEINEGRRSQRVIKFLTDINYCQCDYFKCNVLQIETLETLDETTITQAAATQSMAIPLKAYTCQHVLALRLAKLFKANEVLRMEQLTSQQFAFLYKTLN